jgi:3'-phosphoadenosine 5'-phosphosulfate synthase
MGSKMWQIATFMCGAAFMSILENISVQSTGNTLSIPHLPVASSSAATPCVDAKKPLKERVFVYNDCSEAGQGNCVTRAQRALVNKQKGCTLWMTGLSGSGKSTIGKALERRLIKEMKKKVYRLDGDNIRQGLNRDLGFVAEDRAESVRRVGEVSALMGDSGTISIVSLISPYRGDREKVREAHKQMGVPFYEVLIDVPLAVVKKRDPKGLYAKAARGEIKHFTGLDADAPYEVPLKPEVHVLTDTETQSCAGDVDCAVEKEVDVLVKFLRSEGVLDGDSLAVRGGEWGLTPPDGATTIDLMVPAADRESELEAAAKMPQVLLSDVDLQFTQVIGEGWAAPQRGFMREGPLLQTLHFNSILVDMQNLTGAGGNDERQTDWSDTSTVVQNFDRESSPIPMVLPITAATKALIGKAPRVALVTKAGDIVATLDNPEVYSFDGARKEEMVARTFGAMLDKEHPFVKVLTNKAFTHLCGGEIKLLKRIEYHDGLDEFRKTPAEMRAAFTERGADAVVAFQTRNPTHSGHLHLMNTALQRLKDMGYKKPCLWLSPLGGWTKDDDVPLDVRVNQHHEILKAGAAAGGLDAETTVMGIWPSPMIYAGPTEVQWHAKGRRAAGAKFFVVGRDPAGMKGSDAWQARTGEEDLYAGDHGRYVLLNSPGLGGMELMSFSKVVYDKLDHKMKLPDKSRPDDFLSISGSKMRKMAAAGADFCEGKVPDDWKKTISCVPQGFMPPKAWSIVSDYYMKLKSKADVEWQPYSSPLWPKDTPLLVDSSNTDGGTGKFLTKSFELGCKNAAGKCSWWHDIPLRTEGAADANTFNFVVEIPKGHTAKMEVNKKIAGNPIKQDTKKGKVRHYSYGVPFFNYGMFPQTWEDPSIKDAETETLGDNDPIDVIELGGKQRPMGSIVPVKVIGNLRLLDDGETDDKVLVYGLDNADADQITDIASLEAAHPGLVARLVDWLKMYKTAEGKPVNKLFSDTPSESADAIKIVEASAKHYQALVAGTASNDDKFALPAPN